MPSRELEFNGKEVAVSEFTELEDEAGAVVWDCALVMCHYLLHQHAEGRPLLQGKTVVEVGSGTGVVGIVAAALAGAQRVVLTDLPHLLPWIQRNLQANERALAGAAQVQVLTWGSQADAHAVLRGLHGASDGPPGKGLEGDGAGQEPQRSPPSADMAQAAGPATAAAPSDAAATASSATSGGQPQAGAGAGAGAGADDGAGAAASSSSPSAAAAPACYPDVVIASDVTYEAAQFSTLVASLVDLTGPGSAVLLGFEERPGARDFVALCQQHGFSVAEVPLSDMHPDWRAEEIHLFMLRRTPATRRPA